MPLLKILTGGALLVGIAAVVVWKLRPDSGTDSQRILRALTEIQAAVEAKDVGKFMQHVSENYRDSTVANKRELLRLVRSGLYEPGRFYCQLQVARPQIASSRANVDVTVDFRIERDGRISAVKPFVVRTEWEREKRQWRLVRAEGYMDAEPAFEEMGY